jgi:hypothetical protein
LVTCGAVACPVPTSSPQFCPVATGINCPLVSAACPAQSVACGPGPGPGGGGQV